MNTSNPILAEMNATRARHNRNAARRSRGDRNIALSFLAFDLLMIALTVARDEPLYSFLFVALAALQIWVASTHHSNAKERDSEAARWESIR